MKLLILDFLVYSPSNSRLVQQVIWGLCWKGMVLVLPKHNILVCVIHICSYYIYLDSIARSLELISCITLVFSKEVSFLGFTNGKLS